MIGYHLVMLLVLGIDRRQLDLSFLRPGREWSRLPVLAALGAAGGLAMYLFWPFLAVAHQIPLFLSAVGLDQAGWPFFLLYFCLVNPGLEEVYWRGYLGSTLRRPVLNDFFFAGYHVVVLAGKMALPWLAAALVILTAAAWFWRQADCRANSWLPSILSHFTADFSILLAVYLRIWSG